MIEQQGVVIAQRDGMVQVEVQRASGCGGCAAQGACGTSLLDRVFGRRPSRLWVDNALGVAPGEQVVVGVQESALLRAAAAAYLGPLLGLIGGGMLGTEAAGRLSLPPTEAAALAGAALGFALALQWLSGYSRRLQADSRFRAVLLRRLMDASIPVRLA